MTVAPKPKISAASFTMVAQDPMAPGLSQVLEAAMVAESEACMAEGVTDPNEIKVRKRAAMDKARASFI